MRQKNRQPIRNNSGPSKTINVGAVAASQSISKPRAPPHAQARKMMKAQQQQATTTPSSSKALVTPPGTSGYDIDNLDDLNIPNAAVPSSTRPLVSVNANTNTSTSAISSTPSFSSQPQQSRSSLKLGTSPNANFYASVYGSKTGLETIKQGWVKKRKETCGACEMKFRRIL